MLVVIGGGGGDGAVAPNTLLAGLPLLTRIALAGRRAGFEHVLVTGGVELRPLLTGASATLLADAPVAELTAGRVVIVARNVVPQAAWLRDLLERPVQHERCYDGGAAVVVATDDVGSVLSAAARAASVAELLTALRATRETVRAPFDERGRFVLATSRDVPAAERWLLRALVKSSEGFMSRHFERRVSLAITRRLCTTRVTPNAITIASVALGLFAAPFFVSSAPARQLVGALLFLAHSILDGCDGELARLKFLESRSGAVLDVTGDNVVHTAVFACMAIGWSRAAGAAWPLVLGGIVVASTLATAIVVYRRGMRASTGPAAPSTLSRVADAMVHRDFIYGIVLLAVLGRAWWFLVVTTVGAPAFLALLLWMGRGRAAQAS